VSVINVDCKLAKNVAGVQVCYNRNDNCVAVDQVDAMLKNGATLGSCKLSAALRVAAAIVFQPVTTEELTATAYPNPSQSHFNLKLAGNNTTDAITVRVIDLNGRLVEVRNNIAAGQTIQLGNSYTSGTYFVEVLQRSNRKQLKLVKMN
jgi:hypothetical protein